MKWTAALLTVVAASAEETWTDDTFEQFSRGRLDAAGHNLYVSRDGTLRTIHRFDLNRDGHFDLVFNSTHDYSYFQPAIVASPGGRIELPVEGARRAAIDDLDRDGFPDAVFCPSDSGLQSPRRYLRIAWGSAAGFSPARISGVLPVHGAITVATADFNGDSWPDILVLHKQNVVRVYWGSARGFRPSHYKDISVPGAMDLARMPNGRDVAVLTGSAVRFPGGRVRDVPLGVGDARALAVDSQGRFLAATRGGMAINTKVHARPAVHAVAADADGDGVEDHLFTDERGVHIYWSAREPSTLIPARHASSAAVADLNRDGQPDLAVSIYRSDSTLEADSLLLFGKGGRRFEADPAVPPVETSGATHVAVARGGAAGPYAIFANTLGGTVGEKVPVLVYWGSPNGFSSRKRWEIPLQSGYESSAADLNSDGWPDLIVLNSGHVGDAASGEPTLGANILWGSANGFDWARRTVLSEFDIGSSAVADFDRDGYLDIVLGAFDSAHKRDRLIIHHGGAEGFSRQRRKVLADTGRAVSLQVADLDSDGWLDIAAADSTRDRVVVYRGSATGFDAARVTAIDVPFAISLETADLNGDGRLDLIAGSYQDRESGAHDGGLYLFWGAEGGFRHSNAQWLPGFAPIGVAVADFDADGHLDVFAPHYLGNGTRESLPSYLYWGSREGFHPRRRSALITDSAHDALAADFDKDGRLDLAVSCHTTDGDHRAASKVFYNDGKRFASPRVESLPTIGPHWMWDQDAGHIATRAWKQTYESAIHSLSGSASRLRWETAGDLPDGAQVQFAARWAASKTEIESKPWVPGTGAQLAFDPAARAVQYRLTLVSPDGDRYPSVSSVTLRFE